MKYFKELPDVSDFVYYRTCFGLLDNLDIVLFQKEVMSCLRKRNLVQNEDDFIKNVPYELCFYGYFSKKYRNKWPALRRLLDTKIDAPRRKNTVVTNQEDFSF